ncbi:putative F-box protein At1g47790 isoform X2 [Euphorbia lathyris]|uniref:putative F-box protein At1g47790 isoform X2 n=1 Tax=Euphorbia lathyris TaxID=212925 RepID=UPI0033144C15
MPRNLPLKLLLHLQELNKEYPFNCKWTKKGLHKQEDVVELFPEDIVIEILLKLPVKSLLRFKTVRKSWYSIIDCTKFIKKHLNLAHAARYNQHKNFLGLVVPDKYASYPCVSYKEDSDGIIHVKEFDFPCKLFDDHEKELPVKFCNSCDGLICIAFVEDNRILIWNPFLPTEYKIIQSQRISKFRAVAMGYDPTSDDYKIVEVPGFSDIDEDHFFVEICSLKSSSWRSQKISKRNLIGYCTGRLIYAKNGLHWRCYVEDERLDSIIYFDLAEESLDYVNLPSKSLTRSVLINYKDSIALGGKNSEGQQELWVLKDYSGMKSSWNKIYRVINISPSFCRYFSFRLNGEILVLRMKGALAKYDAKNDSFELVVVKDDNITYNEECSYYFCASPYIESLVSLRRLQ